MKKQRVKKLFIEQLRKIPVVQVVCEKLDISRAIVYVWRKEDEEFRKEMDAALDEGESLVNDLSVSVLLQRIKNGELPPAIFWLRHRHSKFKDKLEIDATVRAQREELTPEQEEAVKKALALAGLLEEQPGTVQSDGTDQEKDNLLKNNHEQSKSESIEQ